MSVTQSLFLLFLLILFSSFFALAEIALAASRPLKLRQMSDEGSDKAQRVIEVQKSPGNYLTVVQIGMNALAILGGIVGEGVLSPPLTELLANYLPAAHAATLGFVISFVVTTSLFIVITDLIPKQVAMAIPEHLALRVIGPMRLLNTLLKPLVMLYVWLANSLIKLFNLPNKREELITRRISWP